MPYKALDMKADCWLWEEAGGEYVPALDNGWPDALNGSYHNAD